MECGHSQTILSLRAKARWWFEASNYDVKIVLLVKLDGANESLLIEKWKTPRPPVRSGATMTRVATTLQPQRVHAVSVIRNPRISDTHRDRFSNDRYSVDGGPLRLEFRDLFLREPTPGSTEGDVVVDDGELRLLALMTWEPEA
ncbi:dead deah box dna helicase [Trichoderma cornu-damae]|uniref:Dead deah box dna helicase n=1 Tax=Trichoderma cornu-damae TaxID=654480 RepID=A0A9P8U0U2_9HYPO|nr:dead deah box dna helicase [Trichoderma cornu-damae]